MNNSGNFQDIEFQGHWIDDHGIVGLMENQKSITPAIQKSINPVLQ